MFKRLSVDLSDLKAQGFEKAETVLASPQGREVVIRDHDHGKIVVNMCSNNYLGLANHSAIVSAAKEGIDRYGYGMASVRFICGTQTVHRDLEDRLSDYIGTEGTILFSSCFDANTGLFETILGEEDAIISDELNHASIIDGIRLSKAKRYRYKHNDMADLERALEASASARSRLVVTDGVFSMDGTTANLPDICRLAERYHTMVMVDDSHAIGVVGPKGRGTPALHGVVEKVHIVTGTLGKALGGASGGYVSGRKEIVDWLRQASRPYLFSNSLMPAICSASIAAIGLAETADDLRESLTARVAQLRRGITSLGLVVGGLDHPIVPIVTGKSETAKALAAHLLNVGILAMPFSYPVVPKGSARVRMQVSASHTVDDIEHVISALRSFSKAKS